LYGSSGSGSKVKRQVDADGEEQSTRTVEEGEREFIRERHFGSVWPQTRRRVAALLIANFISW
jgi:hypothetical protein